MVYVFLAEGFEEIEALGTIDILRRAELDVRTVGVGNTCICGAHGIRVTADMTEEESRRQTPRAVVLPGGMPGTTNLEQSETVQNAIDVAVNSGAVIGAICAAPSILGHKGILNGKRAVCYPDYETELTGAVVVSESAVTDGNIVTGKGAGAVFEFALQLVSVLVSPKTAEKIKETMQCP